MLSGVLHARVAGEEHVLNAGDVLDVPRGIPHQMWLGDGAPARALWETRPPGRTAGWFAALDAANHEAARRGRQRPGLLDHLALLAAHRDVIRLAARPAFAVDLVVRLVGAVRPAR